MEPSVQLQLIPANKIEEIAALYSFLVKMSRKRTNKTFTISEIAQVYPHKPHIIKRHLKDYWRPYVQPVPDIPDTYICVGIRTIRCENFIDRYYPHRRKALRQFVEHLPTRVQKNGALPEVPSEVTVNPPPVAAEPVETRNGVPFHLWPLVLWHVLILILRKKK